MQTLSFKRVISLMLVLSHLNEHRNRFYFHRWANFFFRQGLTVAKLLILLPSIKRTHSTCETV